MESLGAFSPLHGGNRTEKNRTGPEGSFFSPTQTIKWCKHSAHAEKESKAKQGLCRLSNGFFPAVLPADQEQNWDGSVNIHDWTSGAKRWGGGCSRVPWVTSRLRQLAQTGQSGIAAVKLAPHGGGDAWVAVRDHWDSMWVSVEGWSMSSVRWETPQARDMAVSTKLVRGTDYKDAVVQCTGKVVGVDIG